MRVIRKGQYIKAVAKLDASIDFDAFIMKAFLFKSLVPLPRPSRLFLFRARVFQDNHELWLPRNVPETHICRLAEMTENFLEANSCFFSEMSIEISRSFPAYVRRRMVFSCTSTSAAIETPNVLLNAVTDFARILSSSKNQ